MTLGSLWSVPTSAARPMSTSFRSKQMRCGLKGCRDEERRRQEVLLPWPGTRRLGYTSECHTLWSGQLLQWKTTEGFIMSFLTTSDPRTVWTSWPTSSNTGTVDGSHNRLGTLEGWEGGKKIYSCVAERRPCLPSRSDPLYDGERLLILRDLLPEVPGNSSCVLTLGLEDVTGHVH